MSRRGTIAFVVGRRTLSQWPDLATLASADVDAQGARFRSGQDVWVVQTFLLLRDTLAQRGYDVTIGASFPAGAMAVAHWDRLNDFFSGAHRARVIGVRADRAPLRGCEVVVVQNDLAPETPRQRYVPLWPQPGLLPRDAARGSRIARVAYFGRLAFLPPWVTSPALRDGLAALGIELVLSERAWHDYRDVDLVLSARAEPAVMLEVKPATKLYNAWLAGAPALLGDEPVFRALRRSELDYVAVDSVADVLAAVRRLQEAPARYDAMVANGGERAQGFTRDAIAARWLALIDEVVERGSRPPGLVPHIFAMLQQKAGSRRFRRELARGRAEAVTHGAASVPGDASAPATVRGSASPAATEAGDLGSVAASDSRTGGSAR